MSSQTKLLKIIDKIRQYLDQNHSVKELQHGRALAREYLSWREFSQHDKDRVGRAFDRLLCHLAYDGSVLLQ